MKTKCLVIGIVMGLAFAACSPSVKVVEPVETPTTELSAIDSLMWKQPDSAFAMLKQFAASPAADSLDAFNGHYCQLLISELLYKKYYRQSNREELLHAVDYIDSLTTNTRTVPLQDRNVFLDARVHYMNGVGFYEKGDVVQACSEYLKALELIEGRFEEKALIGKRAQFMANTYNRLGDLFSEQFMMESAITCYENALVYCKIEPTSTIGISNILYRIGKQYDKMEDIDKAREYYVQALECMTETNNLVYRDIISSKAVADYRYGINIDQALNELKQIVTLADNETERLYRCMTIGALFYEEGVYDSALYYLIPVFENTDNKLSQIQAAEYLRNVYDSIGELGKADVCVRFLVDHKKSEGENKALVSKLEDIFQQHLQWEQEKTDAERREAERLRRNRIIVVAVVLLVVAVLLAWLFHRRKMRQQRDEASQQIEAERAAHRSEKASMSGRLKRSNEELRELKDQIKRQDELKANPKHAESFDVGSTHGKSESNRNFNSFIEAPICRTILETVHQHCFKSKIDYINYKEHALTKEQLLALRDAADVNLDGFTYRLRKRFRRLTDVDVTYCCFYLLDITDADIAALIQKAYPTVCERKRKIKRIIGDDDNLGYYLRNLS